LMIRRRSSWSGSVSIISGSARLSFDWFGD
jgi:hypothetical protein